MSSQPADHRFPTGYPSSAPTGQRKVAIPRLQKVGQINAISKHRRRVPRACTGCRSHKIKCTGERPSCKHCSTTNRECVYILPRRDRLKIVTDRCHEMAAILRGLTSNTMGQEDPRIAEILQAVEEDVSELREPGIPPQSENSHGSPASRDLSTTDPGIHDNLDTDAMDLVDENLHEDEQARATGFVGKSSEVQWLRVVATALNDRPDETSSGFSAIPTRLIGQFSDQVSSFSYWTDCESFELDVYVDPYELPQPDVAERLLQCYMLKVQDSFPVLPKKLFENQFRVYFRALQAGNAPCLSPKWQAILNLVFAIGAKYSHLANAPWRADGRDHLIYHARAKTFGLNETTIMSPADIPQIQSLGLLAFYWLTVGQISRAWTVIGMALRSAYALGLHVRNEDPAATATKRETLVRTWWSLYSLERILSIVTGRPSIIVDSCCSVPLPLPVAEENLADEVEYAYRSRKASTISSTGVVVSPVFLKPLGNLDLSSAIGSDQVNVAGAYFTASVQLSVITQSVLASLYSAGTMIRSSSENQQLTAQLLDRLEQWGASLPAELRLNALDHHRTDDMFGRERTLLLLQFCSAKILLTRPCLAGRRQSKTNENSFARRMANTCIDTAKIAITFLPEVPNPEFIYDKGPWWSIVHHLMQMVSVFLLALSFPGCTAYPATELVYHAKKALRWLQAMQDPVAERAYEIGVKLAHTVALHHDIDLSDMWTVPGKSEMSATLPLTLPPPPPPPPHGIHGAMPGVEMSAYLPHQYGNLLPPPPPPPPHGIHGAMPGVEMSAYLPHQYGNLLPQQQPVSSYGPHGGLAIAMDGTSRPYHP